MVINAINNPDNNEIKKEYIQLMRLLLIIFVAIAVMMINDNISGDDYSAIKEYSIFMFRLMLRVQIAGIILLLSLIGQLGDLFFSAIKRYFNTKDFSKKVTLLDWNTSENIEIPLDETKTIKEFKPDVIGITGYITHEKLILKYI
mgnify:CR=1 FL=1